MDAMDNGLRIYVGPVEISGIVHGLLEGLESLEVDAHAGLAYPHPFAYAGNHEAVLLRVWSALGGRSTRASGRSLSGRIVFKLLHMGWSWIVLMTELKRSNSFVFLFGKTITNSRLELWLFRLTHKRVVFIYVGSDARPNYVSCLTTVADSKRGLRRLRRRTRAQRRRIVRQEATAIHCINSPSTAQFHTRPFVNWFSFGLPRSLPSAKAPSAEAPSATWRAGGQNLRVLHSPSNPTIKGTRLIQAAVESLRAQGCAIELVTIQGQPNEAVQEELARCDFIVDQVYSDSPMSGFAVEAAQYGKPAVVAGYAAAHVQQSHADSPPSLFVPPEDLESAIARLAQDHDLRRELGEAARRFVTTNWMPHHVAQRLVRVLRDDVSEEWLFPPSGVDYLHGCGMPEDRVKRQLGALIRRYGNAALCVSDKPELERAFVRLAHLDERGDPA